MSEEIKDTSAESATTIDGAQDLSATPANDLSERIAAFNVELKVLLGKHELALMADPRIFKGQIVADPVLRDERKAPEVKAPEPETPTPTVDIA